MAKYEFIIYQQIVEQIEAGHVYLENSISFKSLSSHLISDVQWKNKSALLKNLSNKKLLTSIDQLLNDLENTLESLIINVNKRIESGDNKGIKIKSVKRKIVQERIMATLAKKLHSPFPTLLPLTKKITLFSSSLRKSVLWRFYSLHKTLSFMSAFTHIKPYDAKDTLDPIA